MKRILPCAFLLCSAASCAQEVFDGSDGEFSEEVVDSFEELGQGTGKAIGHGKGPGHGNGPALPAHNLNKPSPNAQALAHANPSAKPLIPDDDNDPLCLYDAWFPSDTFPSTMLAGESYSVSLTVQNGGTPWYAFSPSPPHLGAVDGSDPFTSVTTHYLDYDVWDGDYYTFEFEMTAPSSPGTYETSWRMQNSCSGSAFGPTFSKSIQVLDAGQFDAVHSRYFLSQAKMHTNEDYSNRYIEMRNTGAVAWVGPNFRLAAVGLEDPFASVYQHLPPGVRVEPGERHLFFLEMVAPSVAGTYQSDWQMVHVDPTSNEHLWFGNVSSHTVQVFDNPPVDAQILGNTLPATINRSTWTPFTITVQNTGDRVWRSKDGIHLAQVAGQDVTGGRLMLESNTVVAPGETYTFHGVLRTPWLSGSYTFGWQMIDDSTNRRFGNTMYSEVEIVEFACSHFDSNFLHGPATIPSEMVAGQTYSVQLTMQTATALTQGAQYLAAVNGSDPFTLLTEQHLTRDVEAGGRYTFEFEMTAPSTPGTYVTEWQMHDACSGSAFGRFYSRTIQVRSPE